MIIPHKTLERKFLKMGYQQVIGVDEVGMGCLAGPVVVCAAIFDSKTLEHESLKGLKVKDSKLLSALQREEIFKKIKKSGIIKYKLAYCHPKTIDRINIYQAARQAMKKAIYGLRIKDKAIALIDGKYGIKNLEIDQKAIVKGDRDVFVIALASVIAKVTRDRMMARYAKKYPGYGFEIHKGYGTKLHRDRIKKLGACALHRRSFRLD